MAVAEAVRGSRRAAPASQPKAESRWSRGDTLRAGGWMVLALLIRCPLLMRIEGLLDHDQGVVGLMAFDISEGRRWPIFFDGQRYMGALEAYTAALFVALFGHSPSVVALAPTLYAGLFVFGQYALWRLWAGRKTGHLAALLTSVGSPMLSLWSVAPRGGYIEILAWALPVLGIYRTVTRPAAKPLSRAGQAGWGFLLAFGFFLNPLSLIVYATLAIDWILGRHGAEIRRERRVGGWADSPFAPLVWGMLAALATAALSVACHVEFDQAINGRTNFVFSLGALPARLGEPLGVLGLVLVLGCAAWWTGGVRRLAGLLSSHPGFGVGAVAALAPFAFYSLRVALRLAPRDLGLPIWMRAPWQIGPNLRHGISALGPLVGCEPRGAAFSIGGRFLEPAPPAWPILTIALAAATPMLICLAFALVATVAWRDRRDWRLFWTLRGHEPTAPTVLALSGLIVTLVLYLLQATSASNTSIRYLLMAWIFLPGLLAQGLLAWPRAGRIAAATSLLTLWSTAQAHLWVDMDRPSPLRPVVRELERRGVTGFVASTHVALLVGDLSQWRLGAVEYHFYWPRLHDRFADRIVAGKPIVCVNDLQYTWPRSENFGLRLHELDQRHSGRVRCTWQQGDYEIWEADVPLREILAP